MTLKRFYVINNFTKWSFYHSYLS